MPNMVASIFGGSQLMSRKISQKCGSSYENTFVIQIIIISTGVLTDKITEDCAEIRVCT